MQEAKAFSLLSELVALISKAGPKKPLRTSLETLRGSSTQEAKLFKAMEQSRGDSEQRIIEVALGSSCSSSRYRVIRNRLKDELLPLVCALELPAGLYSAYVRRVYGLRRSSFIAQTLRMLGARRLSVVIAGKSYKEAEVLEETLVGLELLLLQKANAALEGNERLHSRLSELQSKLLKRIEIEQRGEAVMETIQLRFRRSGAEQPQVLRGAREAADMLDSASDEFGGFKLKWSSLRLRSAVLQIQMRYQDTLEICDEALQLLLDWPLFANKTREYEYVSKQAMCAYYLRDYSFLRHRLDRAYELIRPNSFNWFSCRALEFLLLMHTSEFKTALELCRNTMQQKSFSDLGDPETQKWQLFLLYAEYASNAYVPVTRLDQFKRLAPVYSADKAGFNVSMIALQIWILADQGDFTGVIDRIEALDRYRERYLKGSLKSQCEIFFRLLAVAYRADFDRKLVERRAERLQRQLVDCQFDTVMEGIQILPFDFLWDRIMSAMDRHNSRHS